MQPALRINLPTVVFERFDDEIIVVDIVSCSYYSLTKTGIEIWNLIEASMNSTSVFISLSNKYDVSDPEAKSAYRDFVNYLISENLIIEIPSDSEYLPRKAALKNTSSILQKQPFTTPQIQKYDDMQQLLYPKRLHLILMLIAKEFRRLIAYFSRN